LLTHGVQPFIDSVGGAEGHGQPVPEQALPESRGAVVETVQQTAGSETEEINRGFLASVLVEKRRNREVHLLRTQILQELSCSINGQSWFVPDHCTGFHEQRTHLRKVPLQQKG